MLLHLLSILPMLLLALITGCSSRSEYRYAEGSVWHTAYHIKYNSSEPLEDSIRAVFSQVDTTLSMFNDSSLISRINRNDTTARCNSMLKEIISVSRHVAHLTGGAFDPTVAPLVDLWGFGRKGESETIVPKAKVDSALLRVGISDCVITDDGRIVKKHPLTEFDFSAIAKGFACDEIGALFARNGVTDYLIEVGGEIVAKGKNEEGQPWKIMIEAPSAASLALGTAAMTVIEATDVAVATSGSYRRNRHVGSATLSHIINPRTGYPQESHILSATVLAKRCATADAFATACMVLSPDSAIALLSRQPDVEGLITVKSNLGDTVLIRTTPGFANFISR